MDVQNGKGGEFSKLVEVKVAELKNNFGYFAKLRDELEQRGILENPEINNIGRLVLSVILLFETLSDKKIIISENICEKLKKFDVTGEYSKIVENYIYKNKKQPRKFQAIEQDLKSIFEELKGLFMLQNIAGK